MLPAAGFDALANRSGNESIETANSPARRRFSGASEDKEDTLNEDMNVFLNLCFLVSFEKRLLGILLALRWLLIMVNLISFSPCYGN